MKLIIDNAVYVDSRDNLVIKDNGATCNCGKCNLKLVNYYNDEKEIKTLYACKGCGNVIGTRIKKEILK